MTQEMDFSKQEFAAPSNKKGKSFGIVWQGPWSDPYLSMDQVGRRMVVALEKAGMPVSLLADTPRIVEHGVPNESLAELGCPLDTGAMKKAIDRAPPGVQVKPIYRMAGPLDTFLDRTLVTVHHALVDQRSLRNILYPQSYHYGNGADIDALHKYKILLTAIERDRVSGGEADELKKFGQIWVPCGQNREAMIRSGIPAEKVHVVPHPFLPERVWRLSGVKKAMDRKAPSQNRPYIFYNIGKWEPRKDQAALISAFMSTFKPDGEHRLVLKTSSFGDWKDYPKTPGEAVAASLKLPPVVAQGWTAELAEKFIKINASYITEEEMIRLHGMGDCFVSATHGEGWDMPAFDALVAGNHIVSVDTGWIHDFLPEGMGRGAITLIPTFETEPCHRGYGWGISRWIKVQQGCICSAMDGAAKNRRTGVPGTIEAMSFRNVGELAVGKICDLVGKSLEQMKEEWGQP